MKATAAGVHRAGKNFVEQITGQQSSYSQRGATLAQHEVHLRSATFSASSIVPLFHLYSCLKDSYCLFLVNLPQKCFSLFDSSSPLARFLPRRTASRLFSPSTFSLKFCFLFHRPEHNVTLFTTLLLSPCGNTQASCADSMFTLPSSPVSTSLC